MKNIITICLLFLCSIGMAQNKQKDSLVFENGIDTLNNTIKMNLSSDGHITSGTFKYPKKDTVQCYFQVIVGVEKGQLMGQWFDGWVVKVINHDFIFKSYDDPEYKYYQPIYLYHDKKTKVTKKVIQYY